MKDSERIITQRPEGLAEFEAAVEKEVERAQALVRCVGKANVFGTDENDEFRINREDGHEEGIFKTWAVPIIPFLESDTLNELATTMSTLPERTSLLEALSLDQEQEISRWASELSNSPTKLWQTMEKYRSETQISDRRLVEIFSTIPLSEDPHQRVAQLFARLHLAFGYAAPFYHVEAMVGDGHNTMFNPASSESENNGGGALDVVALALPSALKDVVLADELDWKGLDWDQLHHLQDKLSPSQRDLTLRLATLLDVPPTDIVFAANVLEFIPVSVGGKKNDLTSDEALNMISSALVTGPNSKAAIVRDMNALIRFLNWFPLIRDESNFTDGTMWNYAAVCDTTAQLLSEVIDTQNIFRDGFESTFHTELFDQLANLDATSAKGRFLLSLLSEGKFSDDTLSAYQEELWWLTREVGKQIVNKKDEEAITDALELKPRVMVGGKAAGLAEAALVIPNEHLLHGKVVSSEWVHDWLASDDEITTSINFLNKETDPHIRDFWAKEIQTRIQSLPVPPSFLQRISQDFPDELLCVRSSSFDEDTGLNGSAAGVYQSEIGVTHAGLEWSIQKVVASYFSKDALAYRQLHGFLDTPSFAILITPFHAGPGGALFTNGDEIQINIAESPQHVVAADIGNDISRDHTISDTNQKILIESARRLAAVKKANMDIEFVEENDKLIILQARALSRTVSNNHKPEQHAVNSHTITIDSVSDLNSIELTPNDSLRLRLEPSIDLGRFQGDLFRWLIRSHANIEAIILSKPIPQTCHFANICLNLGIDIIQPN